VSVQPLERRASLPDRNRAVSPIVGVVALLVITVALAAVVAVGAGALSAGSPEPTAAFELAVDGSTSAIRIDHVAGDTIDVETLSITVAVDGTELADQPPVPFVGANGFDGTPDGPFNAEATQQWQSGTVAGFSVADTNSPTVERGDTVTVRLAVDGTSIATLETVAE